MTYTITPTRRDAVLINEDNTLLEMSAEIDHDTLTFKTKYMSNEVDYHARYLTQANDTLARWVNWTNYVTPKAYYAALKELDNQLAQIKRQIKAAKHLQPFASMKKIADSKIKHYQADFYFHDLLNIQNNGYSNEKSFIWVVRECGTWILRSNDEWASEIMKRDDKTQEYFIVNVSVTKCSKEEAIHFLSWK